MNLQPLRSSIFIGSTLAVLLSAFSTHAQVTPPNSLVVADDGNVGVGTDDPSSSVHVVRDDGSASLLVEDTGSGANANLLTLRKTTAAPFVRYQSQYRIWDFTGGNFFSINDPSDAPIEFLIDSAGNLTLTGSLTTGTSTYPDYVFHDEYELMNLDALDEFINANGHLPGIPTASDVEERGGVNVSELQIKLLEKVEELTLYTIHQQKLINKQSELISELSNRLKKEANKSQPDSLDSTF